MAQTGTYNPSREDFAAMLDASFNESTATEGSVVKGKVVAIENDLAIIDVGLKTEGRVPLREFQTPGRDGKLAVGDEVEVYLERIENAMGEAVISRDKARREAWIRLEKSFDKNERVDGVIFGRVKGGFTVDLGGAVAFLPGSQVDIRPIRDVGPLMNLSQPFQILKMDRRRGNIVVSRRAVMEETRAEQRSELVQNLVEGQVVDGVVKNITDYGAFVDLGGIDGLLHVTDISWKRVNHPSDVLSVGQQVKVQIVKINPETHRISLGMKHSRRIRGKASPPNTRLASASRAGSPTSPITVPSSRSRRDRGLVHVSEMSWTKKNVHPGKILSTSEQITVQVLEVDPVKRRISLGLKQTLDNPWVVFAEKFPPGSPPRARSRTSPNSACSSASRAMSTAWPTSPTSIGAGPARGHQGLQEGRHRQSRGAGRRHREGAHLARRQAGHRRSDGADLRYQEGRHRHLRGRPGPGQRHRGQDRRYRCHRLHPPQRSRPRPLRAAARALCRLARRSMPR